MAQKTTSGPASPGDVSPFSALPARFAGFTITELLIAVLLLGVVAGMAWPSVGRMRAEAAVRGGGAELSVGVAQARTLAVRYSRPATFVLDPVASSYGVVVDTTLAESGADTVLVRELPGLAGLIASVSSSPAALCFDARGIGTSGPGCAPGLAVVLRAGTRLDTVAFTATGRLIR